MLTDIEYLILNTFLRTEKEYRPSEIKEICRLTEPTLHKYLNKLYKEKYLLKRISRRSREYPHPVFYYLNSSIEIFQKLITEFKETLYWLKFHSSAYCQSMIAPPLLREIEKLWNMKEPYKSEKEYAPLREAFWEQWREKQAERGEEGISEEDVEYIYSDDICTEDDEIGPRAPYYLMPDFFTEEDVLEILKLSPTALKNALKGTSIKEKPPQILLDPIGTLVPDLTPVDTYIRAYFQEMLLASLILDSEARYYPNHCFKSELSIKIRIPGRGEFEKKAGMVKDHSTHQYIKKITSGCRCERPRGSRQPGVHRCLHCGGLYAKPLPPSQ